MKKRMINSTDIMEQWAERLIEEKGYRNFTTVVESSMRYLYENTFKDYVEVQKKRVKHDKESAEERAQRKVDEKEAQQKYKKEKEEEKGRRICEEMGGEIVEGSCKYKTYNAVNRNRLNTGTMQVPLEMLTEEHKETQYKPSKEHVDDALQNPDVAITEF